jgi:hypothetical protein
MLKAGVPEAFVFRYTGVSPFLFSWILNAIRVAALLVVRPPPDCRQKKAEEGERLAKPAAGLYASHQYVHRIYWISVILICTNLHSMEVLRSLVDAPYSCTHRDQRAAGPPSFAIGYQRGWKPEDVDEGSAHLIAFAAIIKIYQSIRQGRRVCSILSIRAESSSSQMPW